jgi:dihydrofolate synthase / folylpolyglutamate synthase
VSLKLQHALEALWGLERRKAKHDLVGITSLLAELGDPQRRFRSVHVAGTNGKGSVCALVERVLREAGVRTGLFTSPHLIDFRERIRVAGRWADEPWLERMVERIAALPAGNDRTFFEVCTALAFQYFAEQDVEIAVVEVGLGGRLDCTNVLTPEVCAITSIGLDHTEILGDTIEAIAAEKAGIIKPGVPVVIGEMPAEARVVIERIANAVGARIVPLPTVESFGALPERATIGANQLTAVAVLGALAGRGVTLAPGVVERGMRLTRWPGRLERSPNEPRLWWDGAHNESGGRRLGERWPQVAGGAMPETIVVALSSDKDAAAMLRALREGFPNARLIATRSRSERALPPDVLARHAAEVGFEVEALPDVGVALRAALARSSGLVLLAGSLFAVGEAMEIFGGAPGEML